MVKRLTQSDQGTNKIVNLVDPTSAQDAATKNYVDGLVPTQTGNSGKYLTTNGTATSWGTAVTGPGSSTDSHLALFNSTTGSVIKDSTSITHSNASGVQTLTGTGGGINISGSSGSAALSGGSTTTVSSGTGRVAINDGSSGNVPQFNGVNAVDISTSQTLTNKSIAAGSNTVTGLAIAALGGITGTPSSSTYLRGDGTWATPSGGSGGTTWNEVTSTSQTAAVNNGYITNNASLVTVTLPSTAAQGSIIEVVGKGVGGWAVAQTSGVSIRFSKLTTTTGVGGSLASTDAGDTLRLLCITANTSWIVLSSVGSITIV